VILFNCACSVIEERNFNTESTKKNSRRKRSARELPPLFTSVFSVVKPPTVSWISASADSVLKVLKPVPLSM
jgi:hypothetical protein